MTTERYDDILHECRIVALAICQRLRLTHLADDAISEAIISVWKMEQRHGQAEPWLVRRRARFAVIDHLRSQQEIVRNRQHWRSHSTICIEDVPLVYRPNIENSIAARQTLGFVSQRYAHVLILRYWHDYKLQEIGCLMGFNGTRACQIVGTAIEKIRESIELPEADHAS